MKRLGNNHLTSFKIYWKIFDLKNKYNKHMLVVCFLPTQIAEAHVKIGLQEIKRFSEFN